MSDSDSADGFASLITNGEQEFWRSYETSTNMKSQDIKSTEDQLNKSWNLIEGCRKKSTATKKLPHKLRKRRIISSCEDSSDSDTNARRAQQKRAKPGEKAVKPPEASTSKKAYSPDSSSSSSDVDEDSSPKTKKDAPATANSLFSTIMNTLKSLPDATPPPPNTTPSATDTIFELAQMPQLMAAGEVPPFLQFGASSMLNPEVNHLQLAQASTPSLAALQGLQGPQELERLGFAAIRTRRRSRRIRGLQFPLAPTAVAAAGQGQGQLTNLEMSIDNVARNISASAHLPSTSSSFAGFLEQIDHQVINSSSNADGSKTPPYKQPPNTELNRIIEVRVLWKSIYLHVFKIRRFTSLKKIIDHYAAKENINPKHLCFSMNDKMVNLNLHSAVTLKYRPGEEIEAGIMESDVQLAEKKEEKGIRLKVRLDRRAEFFTLEDNLKLEHLYAQVALKFDLTFGSFKLEFDGTIISCYDTIRDLDLEEDNYVDILF